MTQHRMSLTTAADTLAAIPALLGYTPDNSVIIIALADTGNGAHAIAATGRVYAHRAEAAAEQTVDSLEHQSVDGTTVTAVILAAIADTTHAGAALIGLDAIRDAFAARGIRTVRACTPTASPQERRSPTSTGSPTAPSPTRHHRAGDRPHRSRSRHRRITRRPHSPIHPHHRDSRIPGTRRRRHHGVPTSCPSRSTSSQQSSTPARSPASTSPPGSDSPWPPATPKSETPSWPCPSTETPTR
ncbi:DUF4192 family protein [Rhodococcus sp. SBT000017]|uniref:DUF4192 family protein n=1 Tax=Rhodococcus sp. SBT000017 TaxID=1803385 RepID=UPI000EF8D741|nr:DUF4192 family protein [Rhodococcus sp. SBT000017]RMB70284.1 DUF4192 family protein [Rhodococcus sp. SBT000017]